EIDQDYLAHSFAEGYDPSRGYGMAMHSHLAEVRLGVPWKESAEGMFEGQGSFGNGAAMRVAPLGAYFADDLQAVVDQVSRSAEINHAGEEAILGAIAGAVAAALSWGLRQSAGKPRREDFLDMILPYVPKSEVSS